MAKACRPQPPRGVVPGSEAGNDDDLPRRGLGESGMKRLLLGSLLTLVATAALAQDAARVTGFRMFVIWEDTGQTSPDWSRQQTIVANDRQLGSSTQARVDIVLDGPPNGMVDDTLEVAVRTDDGKTAGYSLPVGFFAKNRLIRSVIVTHGCNPFQVEAKVGNSRRNLRIELTCGG
jgi:hypothetical protein